MGISLISYFVSKRKRRTCGRLRRRIQLSASAEDSSEKSLVFVACSDILGRYCYKFNPLPIHDDDKGNHTGRKRKRCCCSSSSSNHHHQQRQRQRLLKRSLLEPMADGCGFRIYVASTYVALGSIIYCIGGFPSRCYNHVVDTVIYFDTSRPEFGWRKGPPMIGCRVKPAAAAIDGKLYVFGGGNDDVFGGGNDDDIGGGGGGGHKLIMEPFGEVFDPSTNKWEALPEPPIRLLRRISAVVKEKKMVVLVSEFGKLYGYDVLSNSWDLLFVDKSLRISSLNRILVVGPAVVIDNTLYWYSMIGKKKLVHKIEAYDLEKRMWFTGFFQGLLEWDGLVTPPNDAADHEHHSYPSLLHLGGERKLWCLVWEDHRAYKVYNKKSTYRCIDYIKFKLNKRINSRGHGVLDIQIESSHIQLIHPSLCFIQAFIM